MLDASQLIYLSFPMATTSPVPPAIQPMSIAPRMRLAAGDDANVSRVSFDNHSNTHADAPAHVISSGLRIADFMHADFLFHRPVIIDLSLSDGALVEPEHLIPHQKALQVADLALFRFGYGPVRRSDPARYTSRCPGFGVPGATYLRQECPNLRGVGLDVPSFVCIEHIDETMVAHNVMLEGEGRRCLLIEDMNLEQELSNLRQVLVVPWHMSEVDSTPCTVIGVLA